jgi:hypothetical protein
MAHFSAPGSPIVAIFHAAAALMLSSHKAATLRISGQKPCRVDVRRFFPGDQSPSSQLLTRAE